MRVKRNGTAWLKLWSELKAQSTQAYGDWLSEVLASLGVLDIIRQADIRKALDVSKSLSMTKSYVDLELLIFHSSVETHFYHILGGGYPDVGGFRSDS